MAGTDTGRPATPPDHSDEPLELTPMQEAMIRMAEDDTPCEPSHDVKVYTTVTDSNGQRIPTGDPRDVSIDPIDTSKYPPLGFRFRGHITHPPNAKTPESNDCLNVWFYEAPHGSGRWNGKMQIWCKRSENENHNSEWLDYNGLDNRNVDDVENAKNGGQRCIFMRNMDALRRQFGGYGSNFKQKIYIAVSGCCVTIIGESSWDRQDGSHVRVTKVHKICCCPEEDKPML